MDQLQAVALMFIQLNVQAAYIYLVFFGLFNLLIGYLIFRSTFLPRILGVLMALAGLGWLMFLSPRLANHLLTYIKVLGILAEASLMLWLLVKGVKFNDGRSRPARRGNSKRNALCNIDLRTRMRRTGHEPSNDETDCRSYTGFQGQDGRCP